MAENAKNSTKKSKKVLAFFAVIAILVVTIVLLVVLLPKGKTSQDGLNDVSSITMADNEKTKADYVKLSDAIENNKAVSYYSKEMGLYYTLTVAIDDVSDFYNQYYPLAEKYGAYSGKINKAVYAIKEKQKQLLAILAPSDKMATDSISHLQNLWIDYREVFAGQVEDFANLFSQLNKMYHNCLGQSMNVSVASQLVLNGVDDYMNVISGMIDGIVEVDVKGNKSTNYDIGTLDAKIVAFKNFVNQYLVKRNFISNYHFSDSDVYQQLADFQTKFNEKSFEGVIETIKYNGLLIEVGYENTAVTNADAGAVEVLAKVKMFLKGAI